jgi:hypothetical protein
MLANRGRRGGKRRALKNTRRGRQTAFQKFFNILEFEFGGFAFEPGSKHASKKQIAVQYVDKIPPRMPNPGGPISDATLSMTQYVAGSDMTLATGSAIVGALIRQSTATDVFASWAFALADIPNISAVSSLFDQYRLDKIHFRLRSRNPALFMMNQASPNYSATTPLLVLDRDDNTAPTTLTELKQYSNVQVISACDSIDIVFDPSYTRAVYSGGAFSGYEVVTDSDGWLDVANTTIPHYGIKAGIPALVASTTSKLDWDVEAWYTVSFLTIR